MNSGPQEKGKNKMHKAQIKTKNKRPIENINKMMASGINKRVENGIGDKWEKHPWAKIMPKKNRERREVVAYVTEMRTF